MAAISASLNLRIVTPEKVFFEGDVNYVEAPGGLGYLGILKDHAPLVTTLTKGKLTYRDKEGQNVVLKVEGGFLEVLKNTVLVLTDVIKN